MQQKMKNLAGREDAKLFKHSPFSTRMKAAYEADALRPSARGFRVDSGERIERAETISLIRWE